MRLPCLPSLTLYSSHDLPSSGDQPTSAIPGNRGNTMYSTSSIFVSVSVHNGASTPRIFSRGIPCTRLDSAQLYALSTSIVAAHASPNFVLLSYFMSRYTFVAGD